MHVFSSILLVDPRGWLLLQERDEHPVIDPDTWAFVGGHVDDGEHPDDAAYRELAEETGIVVPAGGLRKWGQFTVFHEAYGTDDQINVYVAHTEVTDADITVGEGRQIVFVDPTRLHELPLSTSAAQILPEFLNSPYYQELLP